MHRRRRLPPPAGPRPRPGPRPGRSGLGERHHNIWPSSGRPGSGKTFLACALANAAIRRGHTALYLRFPRMLDELAIARVGRTLRSPHGHAGPASTSWSSTTSSSGRSPPTRPPTPWRSSRTAPGCARPSSPASCRSPCGTRPWGSRPSPTPCSAKPQGARRRSIAEEEVTTRG